MRGNDNFTESMSDDSAEESIFQRVKINHLKALLSRVPESDGEREVTVPGPLISQIENLVRDNLEHENLPAVVSSSDTTVDVSEVHCLTAPMETPVTSSATSLPVPAVVILASAADSTGGGELVEQPSSSREKRSPLEKRVTRSAAAKIQGHGTVTSPTTTPIKPPRKKTAPKSEPTKKQKDLGLRQMITEMMNSARCGLKKENARGLHIEAALEAQHAVHPFSADEIEAKEIMQALAKMQRFEQLKDFSVLELKEFYKDEGINKIGENYVQKLGKKELVEGLVNHWGQVGVAEYIPLPSSVVPAAGIEKASNVAAYVQRVKSSGEKAEYGTFFFFFCVKKTITDDIFFF